MRNTILIIAISFFFFSCSKKYIRTDKVCDQPLYVEVYKTRELGVTYLTDSINFKIYVGQLNFENEWYLYVCRGDSVFILKNSHDFGTKKDSIIDTFSYNIKELQEKKRFEN